MLPLPVETNCRDDAPESPWHSWRFMDYHARHHDYGYWYCTRCRTVVCERMRIWDAGSEVKARSGVPSDP